MSKPSKAARPRTAPAPAPHPTPAQPVPGARRAPRAAVAPTLAAAALFGLTGALALQGARARPRVAEGRLASRSAAVALATRDDLVLDERLVPPPPEALTRQDCRDARLRWVFPGATRAATVGRLTRALRGAGLTHALATMICDAGGCSVAAPAVVVESVDPAERPGFYAELAAAPHNAAYAAPFRRPRGDVPFHRSPGLPPEAAAVIARTSWTDRTAQYFADLSAACEHVHSDEGRRALILGLHRPTTHALALRAAPGSAERLVASVPARLRAPLRAALAEARARGEGSVPLATIFPPAMRRRLLRPWPGDDEAHLNCFWTSLHFDDGAPRARLLDTAEAAAELTGRFERVEGAPARFGDLLAFYRADGGLEHLAVHLFAGLLFTKNGAEVRQPWRVATAERVLFDYPAVARVELWRRRGDP